MKRILVTGGLGFVGSNLVDKLVMQGHDVTVIDNLSSESSSEKYKNEHVKYYIDDIRNIDKYALSEIEVIFHLAGMARIQPSFDSPLEYIDVNINGTAKVCELAKRLNARLIYSSSSSINNGEYKTPYTYGPREPKDGDYATVVRKFIRQYKNNKPLTIVGDGKQRRDFTHVNDIVDGLIKVMESGISNELYHLGRGVNYSINDLAAMFNDAEIEYVSERKGEGEVTLADYEDTFNRLGWRATHNLKDFIKQYDKN